MNYNGNTFEKYIKIWHYVRDMKNPYKPSKFWEDINNGQLAESNLKNFEDFKSRDINFKLAYWNPQKNGVRYFKDLIYNLAVGLSGRQLKKIAKLKNSKAGNPIIVKIGGIKVSMDSLLSLYESEFIGKNFDFNKANVLEIGAGYGRTAHFIMANYNVRSYSIIDLSPSIKLSRKYLSKVLSPSDFGKINFFSVENLPSWESPLFDICMNMNSFAEMDKEVVMNYLKYIDRHVRYFYTRNPVGKYLDKNLDDHFRGREAVERVLKLGILHDIIDIYDNEAVRKQSTKFLKAYLPGSNWSVLESGWAKPWSFYWQAIYRNHRKDEK